MSTVKIIEGAAAVSNDVGLYDELKATNGIRRLETALSSIGRLPKDFDVTLLISLLNHPSPNIRLLAVKNIGKAKNAELLTTISHYAKTETNTIARREAVSTLGRMRIAKAIPILIEFLKDNDAKIVLQAIRALLPFKANPDVAFALNELNQHPNEIIQLVLSKETTNRLRNGKDKTHAKSSDLLKNVLVSGDVRETIKEIPNESIHLTFTSPPYYNARDYSLYKSYENYLEFLVNIFKEVHRITKEGRFFVLNTSPVIIPRMSRSHSSKRYSIPFDIHPMLTKIGWEFIEDIIWLKPDPSARNRNGGFFQHRKPLGYKANSVSEYVLVYRKQTDKLIDWNMNQYDQDIIEQSKVPGDYEKTNVWKIAPSNDKIHPATFPKELAARVIKFYSLKGDLVFDPFGGSGTVGQAAQILNRFFLLTEQENLYVERATELLSAQSLLNEFPLTVYGTETFRELMKGQGQI
jgi:DNA modification methylase